VLGGRYVLGRQIGVGGYGEVWQAADSVLRRPVAVKLLHQRHARSGEALARFQAEARHAGGLAHENIARIYDYGEPADCPPYLVMELVDGPSLAAVLAAGPLGHRHAMAIAAQTAAGLQAAHAAGVIHRDIKPANLLLTSGGIVKITDFGIAHTIGTEPVTVTGELVGTPGYLSPERAAGEHATAASDLYALGMVLYCCLAGAPPFTGTALEVALAHRDRPLPPLPPSVPPEVTALVMQLAAKDPIWRPASAAEVAAWAGRLRDGLPYPVPPAGSAGLPTVPRTDTRPSRRVMVACASAVAAAASLVLATVVGFAAPRQAAAAPPPDRPPAATPSRSGASPGQMTAASPDARQHPAAAASHIAAVAAQVSPGRKAPRAAARPGRQPRPGPPAPDPPRPPRHGPAHQARPGGPQPDSRAA
jgi:serine/threonine protein kinase